MSDRLCDPETKPASMQTCQQPECASWQAGPWGQCSVTCGQGYQLRAVKCIIGTYMSVVDDNDCNAATRPTDTQDCELPSCHPPPAVPETRRSTHSAPRTQWRFGSWTPCSATCGKGTRMRYVSCRDEDGSVADESACVTLPRPVAKEECSVTPCGRWKALDWSPVSEWILLKLGNDWGNHKRMTRDRSHMSMGIILQLDLACDLNYFASCMYRWYES